MRIRVLQLAGLLIVDMIGMPGHALIAQSEVAVIAVQDTYIRKARPNTLYGLDAEMLTGNEFLAREWQTDAMVQFDLPPIPDGATFQSAELRLFNTQTDWGNRGSANFNIMAQTVEWSEDESTWSALEAEGADYGGIVYDTVFFEGLDPPLEAREDILPREWIHFDVTQLVKAWYDESIENYGFAVVGESRFEDQAIGAAIFPRFQTIDSIDQDFYPTLVIQFHPGRILGDFNNNRVLDAADIDDLTMKSAAATNADEYDLSNDSIVDRDDVTVWIKNLFGSWIGDANLDNEFNSTDLTVMLASGTYEANVPSTWSQGDFNGDGASDSSDLTFALADGGYELGPPAVLEVPELSTVVLLTLGAGISARRLRRHKRALVETIRL